MIYLSFFFLILYLGIIGSFIFGFFRLKNFKEKAKPKTRFSIIIPFRNEAENLPELLKSISKINYDFSKFEVFLINDESSDSSEKIVQDFIQKKSELNLFLLQNNRKTNSPKKDAIQTAMEKTNFEWIVTTDADCIVSKNWLESFNAFILEKKVKMIAAPVTYLNCKSLHQKFQLLDFLSLIGSTIGSFGIGKAFMCNGANLCYEKKSFLALNGFEGNSHLASGDDVFLMEKFLKKYPEKVHFLKTKDAIVKTFPQKTISDLIQQRIRWASKTSSYSNSFGKFVGIIVFGLNFLLVLDLILCFLNIITLENLAIIFGFKFLFDFIILWQTTSFFQQKKIMMHIIWMSLIYPFFCTYVAFLSFQKKYSWKGRALR
ncbi:glycosyltransferase family 2 protein [Aureivirga sp. CE67]|uniref:glycosyltransferase family 2 protein n=1 Tax=Aureivirga sp. CE67 TaxID=1788983 RepID=UPI0018CB3345|nr:glycosyltransferase [Aureivirga sp. CE67]